MGPVTVMLEIMVFFTISYSMTLGRVLRPPRFSTFNHFNRPSTPYDNYGFPAYWDDTRSVNGYPIYCKRLQKKILIDEEMIPFNQCIFEGKNKYYKDNNDEGYSQNHLNFRDPHRNSEYSRLKPNFNTAQNQGNYGQNMNDKNLISSFNAPQNSGFSTLDKEVVENGIAGSSVEKSVTPFEFLQKSGFQVPEEFLNRNNEYTNMVQSSDADSPSDKVGFSNYGYLGAPSSDLLLQSTPFEFYAQQRPSNDHHGTDPLETQLFSKEISSSQFDRDKILSVLNARSKEDSNLNNFYNPSQKSSSERENSQNYFKFPSKAFSNNSDDNKNSSIPPNQLNPSTPKSILKKKISSESKESPSQYYYLSSPQYAPNIRYNQLIPSSYNGLQSGPFSINGYKQFGTDKEDS